MLRGKWITSEYNTIDQEKAFDRVTHEYLFRVLKAFGLGDRYNILYHLLSYFI